MNRKIMNYTFALFSGLFLFFATSYAAEIGDLERRIKGLHTNFTANFSYSSSLGESYTGKIYYQYPNKLHIQLSDGRVIATNGKFLWTYNSETRICARQVVQEESAGGLFYFLHGNYSVQEENGRYVFKRPVDDGNEITVKVEGDTVKSVQFKSAADVVNFSFSNVVTDTNMKSSLFNYKPDPEAQLIENPLNRIGAGFGMIEQKK